ncbi:flagellar hook-associated protein 3 [Chthonomonas calidirosea]|uniref:Flagellar hook-associated protein 3 n=1 Tax=Chthonomonas calidirosea (strain DSM 23976 / ICMP 18418 / T49) TaxID=1303518 RepID=S0EZ12_CHTCT|nr:flagellar hook-associated protein FlgL [Chthonomonas calidirosea]CCW35892.1 flagellar hook-associated protein 3 [Chthonomonas calidirosea T49]CEK18937.1 flagellar hook-associated protein 3 [Chthonomonas calidirosea]
MRISTQQIVQDTILGVEDAYSRFGVAEKQVSTGKRINQPSDDPVGTGEVLKLQQLNSQINQYNNIIDLAVNFLSTTDSALSSTNNLLQQARTIALQAANSSLDDSARANLANQIGQIITQVISLGNSSYEGRYIFAGQRTKTAPLAQTPSGFVYSGGSAATGDGNISLDVNVGESVTINVTGDQVFMPILSTLKSLQDDIANGQLSTISNVDVANIDTQLGNLLSVRAGVGAKIDMLNGEKLRNEQVSIGNTSLLSQVQDTDMAQGMVDLQTAQTAYQAALMATAHTYQYSLLDFLR